MKLIRAFLNFVNRKYVYVGVPVIIQNSKGEILLEKRNNKVIYYPGFWGLPGGMPEYGEKLEDTAKREVKEELGLEIEIIGRSKNIYEGKPNKECKSHNVDVPYYAKIIKGKPKPKDETKDVKWFKSSEIKMMNLAYYHNEILEGEGLI